MQRLGPAAALLWFAAAAPAQEVDFRSDVLPILEGSCFRCHRAAYVDEGGRTRRPARLLDGG